MSLGEVTWTTSTLGVVEQVVEQFVGPRDTDAGRPLRATLRRRAKQAGDADTNTAKCLDVDGPDKTAADYGGADAGEGRHGDKAIGILLRVKNKSKHLTRNSWVIFASDGAGPALGGA